MADTTGTMPARKNTVFIDDGVQWIESTSSGMVENAEQAAFEAAHITGSSSGSGTSNACFVAGTLVKAENMDSPIEQIRVGDLVWAWDEETGDVALKKVVETYINQSDELIHVFVNGEEIITTPEHPFYSPVKGWTEAEKLRAGDILVLVNGEYVVVEKIQYEILETPIAVYNFQVEEYHTYYVSTAGILVHNRCVYNETVSSRVEALNKGREFLGEGYTKVAPGRFVSLDGYRQMRFDFSHHGYTPHHINLDTFMYQISSGGRNKLVGTKHIFW